VKGILSVDFSPEYLPMALIYMPPSFKLCGSAEMDRDVRLLFATDLFEGRRHGMLVLSSSGGSMTATVHYADN